MEGYICNVKVCDVLQGARRTVHNVKQTELKRATTVIVTVGLPTALARTCVTGGT